MSICSSIQIKLVEITSFSYGKAGKPLDIYYSVGNRNTSRKDSEIG